jgi:hypothetical protein
LAAVKARRRPLLALCLLMCTAASPAHAAVKQFHVTGEVLSASSVLAPYGVQKGSVVDITLDVELTTAAVLGVGAAGQRDGLLRCDQLHRDRDRQWIAIKKAPVVLCQNSIAVADNSGASSTYGTS